MSGLLLSIRELLAPLFAVDSIWSVVLRGAIWLAIALVIIIGSDSPDPERSMKSLKSNLGFFLMFLIVSGVLVYMLFGFNISQNAST